MSPSFEAALAASSRAFHFEPRRGNLRTEGILRPDHGHDSKSLEKFKSLGAAPGGASTALGGIDCEAGVLRLSESQTGEEYVDLPLEARSIIGDQCHSPQTLHVSDDNRHNKLGIELRWQ
jgi:hypothetical protein